MKVLLINTNDIYGGAARAAYRLHIGLLEHGINSKYLVKNKVSNLESIFAINDKYYKLKTTINNQLNKRLIEKYKNKKNTIFSTDLFSSNIHKIINTFDVDIVHLHWINGFLDIKSIAKINKPIVWTLHDMWPFTGGCHYDNNCGRYTNNCGKCPLLNSSKKDDLSNKIIKEKIKAFNKIENLTIVGLSKWISDCARKSLVFRSREIVNLPNPINTDDFSPIDKNVAREVLNLPLEKKMILFGAMGADSDERKGYKYLIEALHKLSITRSSLEITVFGSNNSGIKNVEGLRIRFIEKLNDNLSLKILYSAADILLVPSIQENLSNQIIESMSCGTPVVAFSIGGNTDIINHKENGFLAEPFSTSDLAKGIEWALEDETRLKNLSRAARKKVLETYDSKIVIPQYIKHYNNILLNNS